MDSFKYDIAEIFGPTIQGEGNQTGEVSYFIRFPYCDFGCSWCDTMDKINLNSLMKLTSQEVINKLKELGIDSWGKVNIIFTGGNPFVMDFEYLIQDIKNSDISSNIKFSAETQGSIFKPYAKNIDFITISPKLICSGEWERTLCSISKIVSFIKECPEISLKFVIDVDDIKCNTCLDIKYLDMFLTMLKKDLQCLNLFPANNISSIILQPKTDFKYGNENDLLERYKTLISLILENDKNRSIIDEYKTKLRILPQVHFLVWGNKSGV